MCRVWKLFCSLHVRKFPKLSFTHGKANFQISDVFIRYLFCIRFMFEWSLDSILELATREQCRVCVLDAKRRELYIRQGTCFSNTNLHLVAKVLVGHARQRCIRGFWWGFIANKTCFSFGWTQRTWDMLVWSTWTWFSCRAFVPSIPIFNPQLFIPGAVFQGTQRNRQHTYDVQVEITVSDTDKINSECWFCKLDNWRVLAYQRFDSWMAWDYDLFRWWSSGSRVPLFDREMGRKWGWRFEALGIYTHFDRWHSHGFLILTSCVASWMI